MEIEFFRKIFEKNTNFNFRENSTSVVTRGRTDGRRDMTLLIVAFRTFTKIPYEMCHFIICVIHGRDLVRVNYWHLKLSL